MSGWTECSEDIIHILFLMIAPVLTSEELTERRMDWWMAKLAEEESDEECPESTDNPMGDLQTGNIFYFFFCG